MGPLRPLHPFHLQIDMSNQPTAAERLSIHVELANANREGPAGAHLEITPEGLADLAELCGGLAGRLAERVQSYALAARRSLGRRKSLVILAEHFHELVAAAVQQYAPPAPAEPAPQAEPPSAQPAGE